MRCIWMLAGLAVVALAACSGQRPPEDPAQAEEVRNEHLASRGFYRRRADGQGWFMTRSELARSRTLSDALRIVPGVNVEGQGGGAVLLSNRSGRRCLLAVFADGLYTTILNVDELTLEDVEAVEVYRGPSEVPVEFVAPRFSGTCGALVVWSRIAREDEG